MNKKKLLFVVSFILIISYTTTVFFISPYLNSYLHSTPDLAIRTHLFFNSDQKKIAFKTNIYESNYHKVNEGKVYMTTKPLDFWHVKKVKNLYIVKKHDIKNTKETLQ
jgi:hypothetical protein